ncbi:hypothetical protein IVA79_17165 [Bradyrhizobium sp. 138]|uniref:hypothetical protein n=1 Tax=Bradyrhizobium sp. 138 TaxID=2782615 RepID=UPI001FFB0C24|nr:hypothetical protein [Bradyrhizobium sp. 138]MCK1735663.1 hypothetical protein [Bradyrhizobium sp. 138]
MQLPTNAGSIFAVCRTLESPAALNREPVWPVERPKSNSMAEAFEVFEVDYARLSHHA